MGAVFGGDLGLFDQAALAGRQAMLMITTGGPAEYFGPDRSFGDLNTLLFHIHHGMLRFVGYDVLEPVVTYGPAHLDDTQRSAALAAACRAVEQLDNRPRLTFENHQHA